MGGGERWVMGGVGEGWDGWVSGGGEGWVSVGVGESDSTVYPACTLSQVSRVDELLWALAADLEEQWLVGGDQPSHLWALQQCASVCKVRLAPGWVWLLWWAGLENVTPLGGRCEEV